MKNILPELRAERGWTQAELADRLEVSRQTINAIETEKYDPSLPLAFAISSHSINPLPTDARQVSEVLLTSSLGLMGLTLLINLRISVIEAAALGLLFVAQFATPHRIVSREVFSAIFLIAAGIFFVRQLLELGRIGRPARRSMAPRRE